jgi:tetratricopeptide (TPR) repeat protein
MRAAALAGAALAVAALAARAEAQPTEAERLYKEGQEAYDDHRYDAALALWKRSYELSRRPALLFNLAQAYRLRSQEGDCARAVKSYRKFLKLVPDSPRRATAEGWVHELEECEKQAESEDDPQDPGGATTEGTKPRAAAVQSVSVRSASSGGAERVAGLIVAGGGAAAALAGAYFGNRAHQLGDEVTRQCASGCVWSAVSAKDSSGHAAERLQWILYAGGAGGLIAGVALYYLGTREHAPAVAVTPRGGGALLTWSRTW